MEKAVNEIVTVSPIEVFKNRKRILKNPLPFHHENFEKYGDTFKVNIGVGGQVVFTRDAETIQYILQKNHKNYHKSSLQTKDLGKYIGRGLLTSNGDFWRVHRRMVQPAFHKRKLQGLLGVMFKSIEQELQRIKENIAYDVFPLMGDIAFQVVAQSLFSADNLRKRMRRLQEITETNQKMLIKEMRQPFFKWWFHLKGEIGKHLKLSKEAQKLLDTIIEERISSGVEKDDLLDMLFQARYEDGTPMSRQQLIDEVLILFTAGHETTANALSFTLFLLAKNPKFQEEVFKEVGKIDFSADLMDAISQLSSTKNCIEEAMRLYPPVYVIDRVSLETDKVKGRTYEKNTVWLMSMYELHRTETCWKDPDKFDPYRFKNGDPKRYATYYYPFGAGPRMCVGNNFAMFEMVLVVGLILKKYKVSTQMREVAINPLISLKPQSVPLQFSIR
ncbi:cytochrome P450 [Cytophaga sp. FL35]|uniref:cytochrome P450 n=1 Tax=Cytophaga sp. FL35 TaxID=1904456 RepID=UPI0016535FAD|nr:cytochrome P450 [Cytophaga sp. FL35]MBC6997151.1 cytochrome P450 [Cytophaga sp. FL35]